VPARTPRHSSTHAEAATARIWTTAVRYDDISLSPLSLPHARLSLCLFGGKVGGTVDDEGAAGWGGGRGEWG
jgi:hypothetical protein